MKKILVTGGNGFIGRHVVSLLSKKGYEVLSISRSDGDLSDPDFCDQMLTTCNMVVHLAWSTSPHSSNLDPVDDINTNIAGSVALFQASIRNGIDRVVFISSGGTVYGTPETIPIPETHPIHPLSSYGITKMAVEHYLHFFHQSSNLDYSILRGANAYGPGQNFSRHHGVIGYWLQCLIRGEPITIYGDGEQTRDFLYISDFSEAIANAVVSEKTASTFNIGSGRGHSLNEIIEALRSTTGIDPKVRSVSQRGFDVPHNTLDCSKAASEMNWMSQVELEEGIRKTWEWLQAQEESER